MIKALVPDLLFRSKIEETAKQLNKEVVFVDSEEKLSGASLAIVDLAKVDLDKIPPGNIIGYCPHIEIELQKRAKEKNIKVFTRSLFVKELPQLLENQP